MTNPAVSDRLCGMNTALTENPIAAMQTAESLTVTSGQSLAEAEQLANALRALADAPDAALTWDATFGAFDRLHHALQETAFVPQLFLLAHPEESVRAAAAAIEPKVDTFQSALFMDDAVAKTLRRAAILLEKTERTPAEKRLIEHTRRDYRRNGLELSADKREELRKLNEELTATGQAFERNIAEDTPYIRVIPEQLDGLSDTFRAAHPVEPDGLITLTTNYPDLVPFLRDAEDREAARELYARSQNRAKEKNLALLDKLLILRKQKATLLGQPTWAHYVLEPRMAKTPETVRHFLQDLHNALKPLRLKEAELFVSEAAAAGLNTTQGILASDVSFLEERLRQKQFAVNTQEVSQYFEVTSVQKGIFNIVEALYNVQFIPVDTPVWHADVHAFDLVDKTTQQPLARAYLDLYPRPHKYSHAAMFGLRETIRLADGSRLLPIAALVCNFPRSTPQAPGLLTHQDVVTFFHECGHLLHHLLSTCPLASFAGTSVARDFVETPSQLFEEWAWDTHVLQRIGRHHKTGEPIPDRLIQALQTARTFCRATSTERQLFLATLDQTLHTREPGFNTSELVNELHMEFSAFTRIPDTHFQANFGHLVGYDAGYYSYQWALAIAQDVFTRFKENGLMNQEIAQHYRTTVLSQGATQDENLLVQQFLGRPSNLHAYKTTLGIAPATTEEARTPQK